MRRTLLVTALAALLVAALAVGGCSSSPAPTATGSDAVAARMKTIGVIGGVSWQSSIVYYRLLNELVAKKLGPLYSAKILLYNIEFGEFSKEERLADEGDWKALNKTMIDSATRLKNGGADFAVIASNTMNSTGDLIEKEVGIPVLNIADTTGQKIKDSGLRKVALLGTKFTMENPFYRDRLKKYGIEVVTPNQADREYINTVIFDELCAGKIEAASKAGFLQIIDGLVKEKGAQGVVLGCTEIPLLISQQDLSVPAFDTMQIHCEAAVDRALKGE